MRRAFTLIEIIIYIAIISGVAVSLGSYAITMSGSRGKAEVVSEVQANARFAFDAIRQKVRSARSIDTGTSVLGSDPGRLVLVMANPANNTTFDLDAPDGRLRMQVGVGAPQYLTSDEIMVTNLQFTNTADGPREHVVVSITMRYRTAGSSEYQYEYSLEGLVGIRI